MSDATANPPESGHPEGDRLLLEIKKRLPELKALLADAWSHRGGEDAFYRFYHGSFKVYGIQTTTGKIVSMFSSIGEASGLGKLNRQFLEIVEGGTGIRFQHEHNVEWSKHTRPIMEAFFHSAEMLRLMVKYGEKLERAPNLLPSGWAAVLYLYNIR